MEARVTVHSQAYRLRERMEQAEMEHGQEIRADLTGIGIARDWFAERRNGAGEVLFCTMGRIRVRKVAISGDGRPLPRDVIIDGLQVTGAGTYDLLNVLVRANGDLRIIVDDATRVVPVTRKEEATLVAT
ncbi:MAG TPA: hypothetical protein VJQ46_02890 [Gemmatimonadales bacterium]|nr:hypothetical protein [Gemmatimonadales bacterium]